MTAARRVIKISKVEAARRQLVTAADLYFASAEPVSIRTLTMAAYNILKDLSARRGTSPMLLKGQLLSVVPQEDRPKIAANLSAPENFFKHADRDPDAQIDLPLDSGQIELFLFDASLKLHELAGAIPAQLWLVIMWVASSPAVTSDDPAFHAWRSVIAQRDAESAAGYRERMWPQAVRYSEAGQP